MSVEARWPTTGKILGTTFALIASGLAIVVTVVGLTGIIDRLNRYGTDIRELQQNRVVDLRLMQDQIAELRGTDAARRKFEDIALPVLLAHRDEINVIQARIARWECALDPECSLTPPQVYDAKDRLERSAPESGQEEGPPDEAERP